MRQPSPLAVSEGLYPYFPSLPLEGTVPAVLNVRLNSEVRPSEGYLLPKKYVTLESPSAALEFIHRYVLWLGITWTGPPASQLIKEFYDHKPH